MKTLNSLSEIQIFWIIGTFDRLAALGMIHEPPYKTADDTTDLFLAIDERIDDFFTDEELKVAAKGVIKATSEEGVSEFDMDCLIELLLQYKNNREDLMKYALNSQFKN